MVIDSSALMAFLLKEPEYLRIGASIDADDVRLISSVSVLEASIAISSRKSSDAAVDLDVFLMKIGADIIPLTQDPTVLAREGWRRFGKGRHPASLNFGDCCTYGLCRATGEPLLFKGKDFSQTDLPLVTY